MFLRRRLRGALVAVTAGALALVGTIVAVAVPTNPGFETGTTASWTEDGPIDVVTSAANFGTAPVGTYFARLRAREVGTSLEQAFTAAAGEQITGYARFHDGESGSCVYNDFAEVSIIDTDANQNVVYLATSCGTGSTGWTQWSYVAPVAGTYSIFAYVANVGDNSNDSRLGIDADNIPPNTVITAKPPAHTSNAAATFVFHGTDEAFGSGINYLQCKLDGGGWGLCFSPFNVVVAEGQHTFSVRAVDHAGNIDPTPATWTWNYDDTAPVLTFVIEKESGGPGVWTPYVPDTWTTFPVRATWTCTDTIGGGGLIHWLPSGPTHPVNVTTFVQTWTNNGVFTQTPRGTSGADRCQDRAGNSSPGAPAASFKVKKDSSLPLCSVSGSVKLIPVGLSTIITWALVTSDSVSGVASTELVSVIAGAGASALGWDPGSPADTTGTVLFSAKPASVTFTWLVTDNAGNKKSCSATAQAK